ncbi:MAG: hypothetical protein ACYCUF_04580 [Acidimicrobiales bacterium]
MKTTAEGTWRPAGWGVWEKAQGTTLCQGIHTSLAVAEARSAAKLALTLPRGMEGGVLGSPDAPLGELRWIARSVGAGSVVVIRWTEHSSRLRVLRQPVVDALLVALAAGEAAAAMCEDGPVAAVA